jgi:hypothetical protein
MLSFIRDRETVCVCVRAWLRRLSIHYGCDGKHFNKDWWTESVHSENQELSLIIKILLTLLTREVYNTHLQ